jgi:uncharacterized membrane protein
MACITSYHRLSHFRCVNLSLVDVGAYFNLHLALLIRVLLNTRSGLEKSVSRMHYLTRRVIQLGLFATLWSLAGMVTWFLLHHLRIF